MAAIIKGIADFVQNCIKFFQDLIAKLRGIGDTDKTTTAPANEDVVA